MLRNGQVCTLEPGAHGLCRDRPVSRVALAVAYGPGVILGRHPIECLLALLGPSAIFELVRVRADAAASEESRAGGVEPIAGLQVVGQGRLSCEGRRVI